MRTPLEELCLQIKVSANWVEDWVLLPGDGAEWRPVLPNEICGSDSCSRPFITCVPCSSSTHCLVLIWLCAVLFSLCRFIAFHSVLHLKSEQMAHRARVHLGGALMDLASGFSAVACAHRVSPAGTRLMCSSARPTCRRARVRAQKPVSVRPMHQADLKVRIALQASRYYSDVTVRGRSLSVFLCSDEHTWCSVEICALGTSI